MPNISTSGHIRSGTVCGASDHIRAIIAGSVDKVSVNFIASLFARPDRAVYIDPHALLQFVAR
jgi:hypothetical protein